MDTVADLLTRIRNGSRARLQFVDVKFSRLNEHLLEILQSEGYINGFRQEATDTGSKKKIIVELRYDEAREPVISDIQRISRPGLRRYFGCSKIPKIRQGLGVIVLSTSKGLMSDRHARKLRVGGEALCAVW